MTANTTVAAGKKGIVGVPSGWTGCGGSRGGSGGSGRGGSSPAGSSEPTESAISHMSCEGDAAADPEGAPVTLTFRYYGEPAVRGITPIVGSSRYWVILLSTAAWPAYT